MLFHSNLGQATCKRRPNKFKMITAVPLSYLLITNKDIQFEKVTLSDMQNVMTVNSFTADDKYSPLKRDNFTQPIWVILSQKRKVFSRFFSSVLKSRLNFEHFRKKVDPHS